MTAARMRPLLAATAVAAVLAYGLSGHGLSQMSSHDGMAGASVGLCLLLVTLVGYVAAPRPAAHQPAIVRYASARDVDRPSRPLFDGRARASPSALQRFRN
jgi:hypothetical protein